MRDILNLSKLTLKYKGYVIVTVLANLMYVIFNLLSLLLFIPFLKLIFVSKDSILSQPIKPKIEDNLLDYIKNYYEFTLNNFVFENGQKGALLFVCITVLICFILKNIFRYIAIYFQSYIRIAIVRDMRSKIYQKVLNLPLMFFNDERKGDLVNKMTGEMKEIEHASVAVLEVIFREPIAIIISLISLFYMSTNLTLFSLILLPVSGFIISRIGKSLKRTVDLGQQSMGGLLSNFDETITGIKIIKSFVAEKLSISKFEKLNYTQQKLWTKTFRKKDLASPLNEILGAIVLISIVWYGGALILDKKNTSSMTGEEFIGFVIVFSQLLVPIQGISGGIGNLNKGRVSLDRIEKLLNTDEKIKNCKSPKKFTEFKNEIKFNQIDFAYNKEPVLHSINFSIQKGESVALVGESGSGKSTIADLLPRFFDVNSGNIEIDGTDIKKYNIKSLREHIGIVTQESVLFNDSIKNNISFGMPEATMKEIENAAKTSNSHEFISNFINGYDTNIGERGGKLSGGQKQRISIARAVLKNPPIMILDEATSALDTESEKMVQESLNNLMKQRTSLVIAHRLSTIKNADKILVLKKGRIVEQGKHNELIEKNGYYYKLCKAQGLI